MRLPRPSLYFSSAVRRACYQRNVIARCVLDLALLIHQCRIAMLNSVGECDTESRRSGLHPHSDGWVFDLRCRHRGFLHAFEPALILIQQIMVGGWSKLPVGVLKSVSSDSQSIPKVSVSAIQIGDRPGIAAISTSGYAGSC
jgi:hypothetical protein